MKIPHIEDKHMIRAIEFTKKVNGDLDDGFLQTMKRENPGLHSIFLRLMKTQELKSVEERVTFGLGFGTCWSMIREAMRDENLN